MNFFINFKIEYLNKDKGKEPEWLISKNKIDLVSVSILLYWTIFTLIKLNQLVSVAGPEVLLANRQRKLSNSTLLHQLLQSLLHCWFQIKSSKWVDSKLVMVEELTRWRFDLALLKMLLTKNCWTSTACPFGKESDRSWHQGTQGHHKMPLDTAFQR